MIGPGARAYWFRHAGLTKKASPADLADVADSAQVESTHEIRFGKGELFSSSCAFRLRTGQECELHFIFSLVNEGVGKVLSASPSQWLPDYQPQS